MFKIVDNILVNFIDYDDGKPVVLLHDWGQTLETMDHLGRELEYNRKIIPDFPGFGESEEPNRAYNIDDYVYVLRKLLEELNVENPIIIGHSFGGKVALRYASKYCVEKLVLFSTEYKNNSQTLKEKMFSMSKNNPIGNAVRKCIGPDEYKKATPIMRETYINVSKEQLLEDVKNVSVPTLIMWGKEDGIVPIEIGKDLENQLSDGYLVELNGSHFSYLENTQMVVEILNKFFKNNKVRTRTR